MAGALLLALATLTAFWGPSAGRWELVGVVAVGIALVAVQYARRSERVSENATPNDVSRAMLKAERCPCCVYMLSGVPTQPDGCIVCPECGGAWKTPRVTSPHPP